MVLLIQSHITYGLTSQVPRLWFSCTYRCMYLCMEGDSIKREMSNYKGGCGPESRKETSSYSAFKTQIETTIMEEFREHLLSPL